MRRNKIIALAFVVLLPGAAAAQGGIDRVLAEIAAGSTALDVLDKTAAAQQAAAHTGLTLPAPEVGFNYLFGSEAGMGRRQDYSVSQSVDVPTLSGVKRRLAVSRDSVAASQRDEGRTALLLEAKRQCIAVVYENQRLALLERRRRDVGRLSDLIAASAARGEATALDENNARLTLATLDVDMAESRAARTAALSELARMNGGRAVSLADTVYGTAPLPADFAAWFDAVAARWPALRTAEAEVAAARHTRRLTRQENLPSLSVGYMQETTPGEAWRGLSFGLSIPLWANRGKRRQAEAELAAAEARRRDAGVQLRATLEARFAQARALGQAAEAMRRAVGRCGNTELLAKSLAGGQISQVDYLQEMDRYYDMALRSLQMARDAELAKAELMTADL